jgi:hypothetical protein
MRQNVPQVFCGELLYDDVDGNMQVSRFIVRENEIAFDFTDWAIGDRWKFTGVAKLREDGSYSAENVLLSQVVGQTNVDGLNPTPVGVRLLVEDFAGRHINVRGTWFMRGNSYSFSGTLHPFVPRKR